MDRFLLQSVVLPLLFGLGLSFFIECQLQPKTAPLWKRSPATLCIHAGLWTLFFLLELLLFRRPWMAVAGVSSGLYILVLISNAKHESLREPFIYQDFDYFIDVLRHPRLYLPFLGIQRIVIGAVIVVSIFFWGLSAEKPLTEEMQTVSFVFTGASIFTVALLLLAVGEKLRLPMVFDPRVDLNRLGFLASLWAYAVAERSRSLTPVTREFEKFSMKPPRTLPTIVVVQSESFFDVRTLFSGIRPDVLREYDALQASAVCYGQLNVPAWGANTVRSEFSFLSGIAPDTLGVHRFNPYRKLARQGFPTLASFLQSLGYHTVCVHPYPAAFYNRDKVFPKLGFDQFIDIRSFDKPQRGEPYVSDVVLAEKVSSILSEITSKPVFAFVITMENHGPLHLESLNTGDEERFYTISPPAACDDLTVYLRHLSNADRMAGLLRERLNALTGPACLCWFGDHVPIMPKVYAAMGTPIGKTDYLIWKTGNNLDASCPLDINIEDLGRLLLQQAGFVNRPNRHQSS